MLDTISKTIVVIESDTFEQDRDILIIISHMYAGFWSLEYIENGVKITVCKKCINIDNIVDNIVRKCKQHGVEVEVN